MSSIACTNPIVYFINYASWYISNNPGSTISSILDMPNVFPFNQNICCPCNFADGYILSSDLSANTGYTLVDYFNKYESSVSANNCCINYNFNISNIDPLIGNLNGYFQNKQKCCNKDDFNKCVNDLLNLAPEFSSISAVYIPAANQNSGIIEWGRVDDSALNTSVCSIVDVLSDKPESFIKDFVDVIINKGIVVNCKTNVGVIVTSVQTYMDTTPSPFPI